MQIFWALSTKHSIGLFQKKANKQERGESWGHTFLKNPWNFFVSLLYLWKFQTKKKSTPGNSTKLCYIPCTWAIPEKKTNRGGWGHGISRGIEQRICGNSRGQLKKKQNFQGCSIKNSGEISMDLGFWPWNFQEVSQFCWISRGWKLVFSEIS